MLTRESDEFRADWRQRAMFAAGMTNLTMLLDWLSPKWMAICYIVVCHLFSCYRFHSIFRLREVRRFKGFMMLTVWMALLWVFFIAPIGKRLLLLYDALFGYLVPFLLASYEWRENIGPPEVAKDTWVLRRDMALTNALISSCWIYRTSISQQTIYRIGVPATVLTIAAGLAALTWAFYLPLLQYLDQTFSGAKAHWIRIIRDALDVLEGVFLDGLPMMIYKYLSRQQQKRRRKRAVKLFQYKPCKVGEIRLMVLKQSPFRLSGTVEASIIHVSWNELPSYEAISYRWGSVEKPDEILIDNTRFPVTQSALEILLACRSTNATRVVWIDAICINQADEEEKTAQVRMMLQIYERASKVVCFPGGGFRRRMAALFLRENGATPGLDSTLETFANWVYERQRGKLDPKSYEIYGQNVPARLNAMMLLMKDAYFNRVWIIQEIVVGQKVEIYLGGIYIPWKTYVLTADRLTHPHNRSQIAMAYGTHKGITRFDVGPANCGQMFMTLSSLRIKFGVDHHVENQDSFPELQIFSVHAHRESGDRMKLEALLFDVQNFQASDGRDMAFAITGLATDGSNSDLLKPDYGKSVEQVYEDISLYFLFYQSTISLRMLAFAGKGFSENRRSIPSWAVDMSETRAAAPLSIAPYMSISSYRAGGNRAAVITKGELPSSIKLTGVLCDRICNLTPAGQYHYGVGFGEEIEAIKVMRMKFNFVRAAVNTIRQHFAKFPALQLRVLSEQLWVALTADRISLHDEAHIYHDVFPFWVKMLSLATQTEKFQDLCSRLPYLVLEAPPHINDGSIGVYDASVLGACIGRCFAMTDAGRLCLVPPLTKEGDEVFVPVGAQTPCLIRKKPSLYNEDVYELIGEAYLQGIMKGEVMEEGLSQEQAILIV